MTILFVCLHGSAKSLIAAEHLNRLARARGLALRGESAGVEPDDEVPSHVIAGLALDGIDIRGYSPRAVTAQQVANATRVISFGCDLQHLSRLGVSIQQWDNLPMVSDGYDAARDAIIARVSELMDERSI
jgi:arsenate reductase